MRHPVEHVYGDRDAADLDDVLRDALNEAGIGYEVRPYSPPA